MSTGQGALLPGGQENALSFLSVQILNPRPSTITKPATTTATTSSSLVSAPFTGTTAWTSLPWTTKLSSTLSTINPPVVLASVLTTPLQTTSTSSLVGANLNSGSVRIPATTTATNIDFLPVSLTFGSQGGQLVQNSAANYSALPSETSTSAVITPVALTPTTSTLVVPIHTPTNSVAPSPTTSTSSASSPITIQASQTPTATLSQQEVTSSPQGGIPTDASQSSFPTGMTDNAMAALPTSLNFGSQGGQLIQNNASGYSVMTVAPTRAATATTATTATTNVAVVAPVTPTPTQDLPPLVTSINYGSQGGVLVENSLISGYTTLTVAPTSIIPIATTSTSPSSTISRVPFPPATNSSSTSKSSSLLGTMVMGGAGSLTFATPTQGVNCEHGHVVGNICVCDDGWATDPMQNALNPAYCNMQRVNVQTPGGSTGGSGTSLNPTSTEKPTSGFDFGNFFKVLLIVLAVVIVVGIVSYVIYRCCCKKRRQRNALTKNEKQYWDMKAKREKMELENASGRLRSHAGNDDSTTQILAMKEMFYNSPSLDSRMYWEAMQARERARIQQLQGYCHEPVHSPYDIYLSAMMKDPNFDSPMSIGSGRSRFLGQEQSVVPLSPQSMTRPHGNSVPHIALEIAPSSLAEPRGFASPHTARSLPFSQPKGQAITREDGFVYDARLPESRSLTTSSMSMPIESYSANLKPQSASASQLPYMFTSGGVSYTSKCSPPARPTAYPQQKTSLQQEPPQRPNIPPTRRAASWNDEIPTTVGLTGNPSDSEYILRCETGWLQAGIDGKGQYSEDAMHHGNEEYWNEYHMASGAKSGVASGAP